MSSSSQPSTQHPSAGKRPAVPAPKKVASSDAPPAHKISKSPKNFLPKVDSPAAPKKPKRRTPTIIFFPSIKQLNDYVNADKSFNNDKNEPVPVKMSNSAIITLSEIVVTLVIKMSRELLQKATNSDIEKKTKSSISTKDVTAYAIEFFKNDAELYRDAVDHATKSAKLLVDHEKDRRDRFADRPAIALAGKPIQRMKAQSLSSVVDVHLSIARAKHIFKVIFADRRVIKGAKVMIVSMIETIISKLLNHAGCEARDNKKQRITNQHIANAIDENESLSSLLSAYVIPGVIRNLKRAQDTNRRRRKDVPEEEFDDAAAIGDANDDDDEEDNEDVPPTQVQKRPTKAPQVRKVLPNPKKRARPAASQDDGDENAADEEAAQAPKRKKRVTKAPEPKRRVKKVASSPITDDEEEDNDDDDDGENGEENVHSDDDGDDENDESYSSVPPKRARKTPVKRSKKTSSSAKEDSLATQAD